MSTNVSQSQAFCIKLNSHQADIIKGFHQLYFDESLVDVTISCGGGNMKAHKVVLSASSNYFKSIFTSFTNPCQYPVVIIKDIQFQDLKAIVEFMYCGEITVPQSSLQSLLSSARMLQIKGLSDIQISSSGAPYSKFNGSKQQQGSVGFELTTIKSPTKRRRRRKRLRKSNSADDESSSSDVENATPDKCRKETAEESDSSLNSTEIDEAKSFCKKKESPLVPLSSSATSQPLSIKDAKTSISPQPATALASSQQQLHPAVNKPCLMPSFAFESHPSNRKQWADEESKALVESWYAEYTRTKIGGESHLSYKSVCEQLRLRGVDCTPNQVREKVRALKNNYNAIKLGTAKQLVRNHMLPFMEKLQVVLEDSGSTEFSPQGGDNCFSSTTYK